MAYKPHRQIKFNGRIGDPSSQYGYHNGRTIDDDCIDKKETILWAENKIFDELEKLIVNQISYESGVMSQEQKWDCIVSASLKLKEKYNL